jgi:cytoskeleton protein RodZ
VTAKPTAVAGPGNEHTLTLTLDAPSWVEITDADGKQLEYSLLPAGTRRSYDTRQALNVRIGNADGTEVTLDGKPLALEAFRRANVAHLHIGFQDGKPVTQRM